MFVFCYIRVEDVVIRNDYGFGCVLLYVIQMVSASEQSAHLCALNEIELQKYKKKYA